MKLHVAEAILKNCQCIQIVNALYINLIVLFLSFFSFFFSAFLQNLLHNFRLKQCKGTMSYQLSTIKSFTQLKKHLLSLRGTLKMRHHHYHPSSSSSETESDEDVIPPSLKINKVRHTLVSNKIKNMSKIPETHNSKDSVTFVMTSGEAKCVSLETSVSKKHGESLQPSTPEYSKKTTPKVVSDKCVTSETSISNTCKGGESLPPNGQKSSKKTTPKVLSDKCVTSKTSVSKKCGPSLPPNGQKSSKKDHTKSTQ